jgi:hypothetical protein
MTYIKDVIKAFFTSEMPYGIHENVILLTSIGNIKLPRLNFKKRSRYHEYCV